MGKLVNIVLSDGTVAAVSEEDAARLTGTRYGHVESTAEQAGRARASALAEQQQGVVGTARAFVEGAADTATVGGYGKATEYFLGDEFARESRLAAQHHPIARLTGEIGTILAPTGLLGASAKAAGSLTAVGGAARLGAGITARTGSKVAGRVAEGAILGAGGHVASTSVSGDPLTVEGLVAGAGVGGVLNVGAGFLADRLTGVGGRAKKAVDAAEELAQKTEVVKTTARHFEADAGVATAYKQFATAVKVRQATQQQAVRQWEKRAADYEKFAGNNARVTRAIQDAENTVRSVRQRYGAPIAQADEAVQHPGFDVSDVGAKPTVTTPDGKAPIGADLDARLRDYQARVSRIYQMKGGRTQINPQKWSRASGEVDRESVMRELRSLYSDLQRDFPKAAGRLKGIPEVLPPRPVFGPPVEIAPTFKKFVNQRTETIERLANDLGDDTAVEFKRVVDELGIPPSATPRETIAAVHKDVKSWLQAIDDVKSAGAKEAEGSGFFKTARQFAINAARFKFGFGVRQALGGGAIGTAAGVGASAVAGAALKGADNAMVNGAMLTAKTSIKDRIASVVAKWAAPAAARSRELGPVTAYLTTSHFSGLADSETDTRKLARRRADEIHGTALTAPDAAYTAVEGLMGHPSDVAFKVHSHVTNAVNYLQSTLPLDPGLDIKMFQSNWTPSWHESVALAHRLEAVHAPLNALARLMTGAGHPAAADALWAVWPAIMNQAAQDVVELASQRTYSMAQASAFSRIFRTPLTGFQNPVVITALQGQYLPQPEQPGTGGARGGVPAKPTGRPPAVQSPVAGSSVASLIS